jgi:hypothetical protein
MAACFRCDRPGCKSEVLLTVAASNLIAPDGWLVLVEEGRLTIGCSIECFDVVWGQRVWREQEKGRKMRVLDVDEKVLY